MYQEDHLRDLLLRPIVTTPDLSFDEIVVIRGWHLKATLIFPEGFCLAASGGADFNFRITKEKAHSMMTCGVTTPR